MGIVYEDQRVYCNDIVTVEEAEGLLDWLQRHPKAEVDLTACQHLHAANLQVLMAVNPAIAAWPEDAEFSLWLKSALGEPAD